MLRARRAAASSPRSPAPRPSSRPTPSAKLLRQGLDAHCAVMPEDVSPALDAFRLPLSAIRDAELIVVLGDDPVVERAPIVDLWLKAARRAGAEVVETRARSARRRRRDGPRRARQAASASSTATILIWSGPERRRRRRRSPRSPASSGFAEKPGSGAFHLLDTANGRGVADAWAAAADGEPMRSGADRAADRLGRRGRREPRRPRARRASRDGCSRSRCSARPSPAGPTSSSPARATSSATGRT